MSVQVFPAPVDKRAPDTATLQHCTGSIKFTRVGNAVIVVGDVTVTEAVSAYDSLCIGLPYSTDAVIICPRSGSTQPITNQLYAQGQSIFTRNALAVNDHYIFSYAYITA